MAVGKTVKFAQIRKQTLFKGAFAALLLLAVCFSGVAVAAEKGDPQSVVVGNKDTRRYHLPGMPYYHKVAKYHRVYFNSESEAIRQGYYKAGTGKDLPGSASRSEKSLTTRTAAGKTEAASPKEARVVSAASSASAPSRSDLSAASGPNDQTAARPPERQEGRRVSSGSDAEKKDVGQRGTESGHQTSAVGNFPEYDLNGLYQQALKHSEKIKFAEENVFIAQMYRKKAWAVLIPRVTAFGTYNRFSEEKFTPSGMVIQPEQSGTWGVRADQSFSLSARELDALTVSGQMITKSEHDLEAAKSDFVIAVASAYYDVLRAKKGLEIAAANMERLTQYRSSVEKRLKVGEATKTALLRADGELSGARADYLRATNALYLTRAALVRITGIEETFRLKEEERAIPEVGPLTQLRETAEASRADLKSYEMQKEIAEKQVAYARGAFWPNVGLYAVYNGADQNPATTGLVRESVLAGVSLNFPFFEGGLRVAEYREARAKERQANLAYDDLKKNIDVELRAACLDLETQKGSLRFLEDQLLFAQDNYNAVLRQYENGLATSLDVMDANALLLSAEKNVAEALYAYQLAHLKVKKSSGTLLKFIHEDQ